MSAAALSGLPLAGLRVLAVEQYGAGPFGTMLLAEVFSAKIDADKKPVVGADGFFVPDQPVSFTAMGRDAGWGKDIPDMLRNEDWNYAVFTPAK